MAGRVQRGIEHPQIGKHGESSGSSAAAPQPLEIMLGLENENYFLPHNMVKHPEMPATQLHEHYQHAERHTLEGFADALVHNYMRHVFYREFRLAASIRMFSLVCDDEDEEKEAPQQRYLEWCVEEDASLPNNTTPPFGVEIISPVLNAAWWKPALGEMWRDYLEQHYHITGSPPNSNPENEERCTTHVHTSMREPFTVDQIKRIVCGYIMLEPALEAVLPDAIQVRGASYIKSIYFDNPNFARRGLTREQAVGEVKRRSTILQIIDLIQPDFNSNLNRKHWGLNFLNLLKLPGAQTIEYRRGNFSVNQQQVEMWATVAIGLIYGGVRTTMEKIESTRCTVENLYRYMYEGIRYQPTFDQADLNRFFQGKQHEKCKRPRFCGNWPADQRNRAIQATPNDERY